MSISIPALPYAMDALDPFISAETLEYHYGKHHQAYLTNLKKLIEGTPLQEQSLESIILEAKGGLFNNAAQVWNHSFYWNSLAPGGGAIKNGALADAIVSDFGSIEAMKEQLATAAATQFGSGWAWLVLDAGKLEITQTANADLPMKHGQIAILNLDVWEHAYYIDYRNARPKYIATVIDNLLNWDFAEENYQEAIR